jgi:eukaryotic-like serine/threonine-protein kinase
MTATQGQSPAPVSPGDVLAGKYRVEQILGVGGMGVVVAARHMHLDQRVAIKFLLPELASHAETVARFSREARAAVKIQSEHVARVIDVGTLETGAPYMVMEYLEGSDLSRVVQQRGPMPWHEVVEILLQACEAIAEAHVGGIVHRDLKPANLFLIRRPDGSPCVKVLDFGISKALDAAPGSALTQTSAMMGSPKYMSPEQLKSSRDVDARTDIWALGIILYELISGEAAFQADTMPQLFVAIIQDPPRPLRRPDVPPGLHAVILRCLEKDPSRRFQSVSELAQSLYEFAPVRSRPSVERISRIQMAGSDTTAVPSPAQHAHPHAQSSPSSPHAQQAYSGAPTIPARSGYGGAPIPTLPSAGYPPNQQAAYPPAQGGYGPAGYGPSQGPPGAHAQGGHAQPMGQQRQQPMAQQGGYGAFQGQRPHPPPPQPPSSMHPAHVVLITLAVVFALSAGGCMLCVCVGAAAQ